MEKLFPLDGVPCVVCGRPGHGFMPGVGVKHHLGWCRIGAMTLSAVQNRPVEMSPKRKPRAA